MKKFLFFALVGFASICRADTQTPRLGLILPTIGSPTWGQKINGNFQILDSTVTPGSIIAGATYYINNTATTPGTTSFIVNSGTVTGSFFSLSLTPGQCIAIDSTGLFVSTPCGGGSGIPGGPNRSIQLNNLGVLDGTSTLTMNTATNLLTVGANTTFSSISTTQWTNVSTMTFGSGTDLQLQYLTAGNCLQLDSNFNVVSSTNGPCGSGSGGGSSSIIYPATATPTFPFGVNASSFTSTGSGAGSLTLEDTAGTNFVTLKSSGVLAANETYILPDSTGTVGNKSLSRGDTNADGSINTFWGTASDPNAAILTATETFSAGQTFTQSVTVNNVSSTTFTNVSSMVFTNSDLLVLSGSTFTLNSGLSLNGSFGTAGQVPTSNGPGAALTWGAGGGGGTGSGTITSGTTGQMTYYSVTGTTVAGTSNLVNNTSSVTIISMAVTSTSTFGGPATFNSVSSVTLTNSDLVVNGGLISGTTAQLTRIQYPTTLKLTQSGNVNTQFGASTVFASADNTVNGRTVHNLGSVNTAGGQVGVGVDNATSFQNLYPYASYEASINGDGLGLNQGFFGVKSKTGEDTFFFVASGTNTSCGASCFYNNPSTPSLVVNLNSASASYGFVGIGVSTPTVSLDVAGTIQGVMKPTSKTLSQLQALAPASAGLVYYCSDCTTDGIVVSTGTAAGSFGRVSARSTVIQ